MSRGERQGHIAVGNIGSSSPTAMYCLYRQWRYHVIIGVSDKLALPPGPMNQLLSVPSQVGLIIRAARKAARLTQKELAAKLGLSQNRLSELETDPGSMRVDQLLSVVAALGLELQVQPRSGVSAARDDGAEGGPADEKVEW